MKLILYPLIIISLFMNPVFASSNDDISENLQSSEQEDELHINDPERVRLSPQWKRGLVVSGIALFLAGVYYWKSGRNSDRPVEVLIKRKRFSDLSDNCMGAVKSLFTHLRDDRKFTDLVNECRSGKMSMDCSLRARTDGTVAMLDYEYGVPGQEDRKQGLKGLYEANRRKSPFEREEIEIYKFSIDRDTYLPGFDRH